MTWVTQHTFSLLLHIHFLFRKCLIWFIMHSLRLQILFSDWLDMIFVALYEMWVSFIHKCCVLLLKLIEYIIVCPKPFLLNIHVICRYDLIACVRSVKVYEGVYFDGVLLYNMEATAVHVAAVEVTGHPLSSLWFLVAHVLAVVGTCKVCCWVYGVFYLARCHLTV